MCRFGLAAAGLALVAALALWLGFALDLLPSWLIAINLVALLAYAYDKAVAGSPSTRVPETVLLALAALGGTLGAFAGMRLFHHKTAKGSFQLRFWLVTAVQVGLVAVYLFVRPRG